MRTHLRNGLAVSVSSSTMTSPSPLIHKSVLLEESIQYLDIHSRDILVDGTFGGGGHSQAILERYKDSTLICVDLDAWAAARFSEKFQAQRRAKFVSANFKDATEILKRAGVSWVNKVLLDLGTSTFQLLCDTRGFSFQSDAPLRMTFSTDATTEKVTAADIVNTWQESSIAEIVYHYGEERAARKIARAIVAARTAGQIKTSKELAEIIAGVVPRRGRAHPATKTFQALRIAVNDELRVLEQALANWWEKLVPGGRIAVISFHSLEDRIVKRWIKALPIQQKRVITKKPVTPSRRELQANPRARSAKLRVVEKL